MIDPLTRYLGDHLYSAYHPNQADGIPFGNRLHAWLDQVSDSDQGVLSEMVKHIYYVGDREIATMYEDVHESTVARWLIDQMGGVIEDTLSATVELALASTEYSALTDSFDIARYHHVNQIGRKNVRITWYAARAYADPDTIREKMDKRGVERIVVLEDFVGSGTQASEVLRFAATASGRPLLFAPLIVCPAGNERLKELCAEIPDVTYSPYLILNDEMFVGGVPRPAEDAWTTQSRECLLRLESRVGYEKKHGDDDPVFGWQGMGALVVMNGNCPNNTVTALWHQSATWTPLFIRNERV